MSTSVNFTPAAEKFLRRVVRFSGLPAGAGLRLCVSAGGCSGYAAEFSAESRPRAGDSVIDLNGLPVFLPAGSRLLLEGVTVDFSDTPMQTGLSFFNPNAGPCACGSSAPAQAPAVAKVALGSIRAATARAEASPAHGAHPGCGGSDAKHGTGG